MRTILSSAALALLTLIPATHAGAQPTIIERLLIVQGSVGQPGRERAYLNFQNAEQIEVSVVVVYTRPAPHPAVARTYTIAPEARLSVDLAMDVPVLIGAYFSVTAEVSAPDELPAAVDMRLTWHRDPDGREVETLTAVTRRTPKR